MSNTTNLTGLWFVMGVFIGSSIWWISLSWLVSLLRGKILQSSIKHWINFFSGLVILSFGLFSIISVLKEIIT